MILMAGGSEVGDSETSSNRFVEYIVGLVCNVIEILRGVDGACAVH